MEENKKIKSFTDLLAWQEAHKMVVHIYKTTDTFPRSELHSLTNQMRRSAASVSSNIAEGFGRRSYKEKVQFDYLAQGSLIELKDQLLIARDVGYLRKEDFDKLALQANQVHRLLQGLITKSKSYLNHTT